MPRGALALMLLACAWGAWQSWSYRELRQPPGVLVGRAPQQAPLDEAHAEIVVDDFRLRPVAQYRIEARLLGRERYRMDAGAALAPLDLAVGWGPMSDTTVLDALDISQSNRFFHVAWRRAPIPESQIMRHASNMHVIAATPGVARVLDRMRPGQRIELEGRLVDAVRADGWKWKSSLSRTDTGAGACELMWVERARVLH